MDNLNSNKFIGGDKGGIGGNNRVIVMENKKRRTELGQTLGLYTELGVDSEDEDLTSMDQDEGSVSKNVNGAGSGDRARLTK